MPPEVLWKDKQAYIPMPISATKTPSDAELYDVEPVLLAIPTVYIWTDTVTTVEEIVDYDVSAKKLWGIDPTLDLTAAAADFYLLYDLWLDGLDEGNFEPWLSVLVNQFSDYTDMIVGGELRHLPNRMRSKANVPEKLSELFTNIDYPPGVNTRHYTWWRWHEFRETHGIEALEWAIKGFRCFRVSGFGGPKWATIAETLKALLTGVLTPIAFVDFCWGLQHNNGTFFGKVWPSGYELRQVLNANLAGDMATLKAKASGNVRELYTTQRGV